MSTFTRGPAGRTTAVDNKKVMVVKRTAEEVVGVASSKNVAAGKRRVGLTDISNRIGAAKNAIAGAIKPDLKKPAIASTATAKGQQVAPKNIKSASGIPSISTGSRVASLPVKRAAVARKLPSSKESEPESVPSSQEEYFTAPVYKLRSLNEPILETAKEYYFHDKHDAPNEVTDFDLENINEPFAEPHYTHDIFKYYRSKEAEFRVVNYMSNQPEITSGMRSVLVDWMVEIQENFELNHETLYLAVKMVDMFLSRKVIPKDQLQLLGATCVFIFVDAFLADQLVICISSCDTYKMKDEEICCKFHIACKFDERCPPAIDDFIYICDDAYERDEFIHFEMTVLEVLKFQLGAPLSYRFLRRYARAGKLSLVVLTLARFILETSLMDYTTVNQDGSKMAAAALLLALNMKQQSWNVTLEYYTGYKELELISLRNHLNGLIKPKDHDNLKTIRTKYTHKIFHEVALIPPLSL